MASESLNRQLPKSEGDLWKAWIAGQQKKKRAECLRPMPKPIPAWATHAGDGIRGSRQFAEPVLKILHKSSWQVLKP